MSYLFILFLFSLQPGVSLIQSLIKPIQDSGEPMTLNHLLKSVVPDKVADIGKLCKLNFIL